MDKPKGIKNFTEQEIESAVKWASDPENIRYAYVSDSFEILLMEKYLEQKYGNFQDIRRDIIEKEMEDIYNAVYALQSDKIHLEQLKAYKIFVNYILLKRIEKRQNASQS